MRHRGERKPDSAESPACPLWVKSRPEDLAIMGATLANGGVDPKTNERVVIAEVAWYLLSQLRQTGRQGSRQQGQA